MFGLSSREIVAMSGMWIGTSVVVLIITYVIIEFTKQVFKAFLYAYQDKDRMPDLEKFKKKIIQIRVGEDNYELEHLFDRVTGSARDIYRHKDGSFSYMVNVDNVLTFLLREKNLGLRGQFALRCLNASDDELVHLKMFLGDDDA